MINRVIKRNEPKEKVCQAFRSHRFQGQLLLKTLQIK